MPVTETPMVVGAVATNTGAKNGVDANSGGSSGAAGCGAVNGGERKRLAESEGAQPLKIKRESVSIPVFQCSSVPFELNHHTGCRRRPCRTAGGPCGATARDSNRRSCGGAAAALDELQRRGGGGGVWQAEGADRGGDVAQGPSRCRVRAAEGAPPRRDGAFRGAQDGRLGRALSAPARPWRAAARLVSECLSQALFE